MKRLDATKETALEHAAVADRHNVKRPVLAVALELLDLPHQVHALDHLQAYPKPV